MLYCQGNWKQIRDRGRAANLCPPLPSTGTFGLLEFLSLRWQLLLRTRKVTRVPQNYENEERGLCWRLGKGH